MVTGSTESLDSQASRLSVAALPSSKRPPTLAQAENAFIKRAKKMERMKKKEVSVAASPAGC